MADKKISQLNGATTPLAGTEVLPIVQSGSTVKVASDDLTVKNLRSNASSGILQVTGPGAGSTRVMTVPNANFTAARTDAAQTFTGDQTFGTVNATTVDTTNIEVTNVKAKDGTASFTIADSTGAVSASAAVRVNNFLSMLTGNAGGAPKTGVKWVQAQSQIDNPVVDLLTVSKSAASRVVIVEVTVYQALIGTESGNVQRGYAKIKGDSAGTIDAMALVKDLGTANLGTLAWNGSILQYTTNRASNFDTYSIEVKASGSDTLALF